MNINKSTGVQHVYCVPQTSSPLIIAVDLAPLLLHPNLSTDRAADDQRLGSLDDTFLLNSTPE